MAKIERYQASQASSVGSEPILHCFSVQASLVPRRHSRVVSLATTCWCLLHLACQHSKPGSVYGVSSNGLIGCCNGSSDVSTVLIIYRLESTSVEPHEDTLSFSSVTMIATRINYLIRILVEISSFTGAVRVLRSHSAIQCPLIAPVLLVYHPESDV